MRLADAEMVGRARFSLGMSLWMEGDFVAALKGVRTGRQTFGACFVETGGNVAELAAGRPLGCCFYSVDSGVSGACRGQKQSSVRSRPRDYGHAS